MATETIQGTVFPRSRARARCAGCRVRRHRHLTPLLHADRLRDRSPHRRTQPRQRHRHHLAGHLVHPAHRLHQVRHPRDACRQRGRGRHPGPHGSAATPHPLTLPTRRCDDGNRNGGGGAVLRGLNDHARDFGDERPRGCRRHRSRSDSDGAARRGGYPHRPVRHPAEGYRGDWTGVRTHHAGLVHQHRRAGGTVDSSLSSDPDGAVTPVGPAVRP